jgi:di/tricarboxylate transporter
VSLDPAGIHRRQLLIALLILLAVVSILVLTIKDRISSKPCPECRERVKSAAVSAGSAVKCLSALITNEHRTKIVLTLAFVVGVLVIPVVINIGTDAGHFDWIKQHFRSVYTAILAGVIGYFLFEPNTKQIMMDLYKQTPSWFGYLIMGTIGAVLLCACWWLAGFASKPRVR